MRSAGSIRDRATARAWSVACALIVGGCDGNAPSYRSPTAPPASIPPPVSQSPHANYVGDAIVVSSIGTGGCGWGTRAGESRAGVGWRITWADGSISLDEDMSNYPTDHLPFTGSLDGHSFSARYSQGADYYRWECQFREASLTGSFSADFGTFGAEETLIWGTPDHQTVVVRHWQGRRAAGTVP